MKEISILLSQIVESINQFISITFTQTLFATFFGAGSAFLLNYFHEKRKIKEKELNLNIEFMSRLYIVGQAIAQYRVNYLGKDKLQWNDLPIHEDLVLFKPPLNVEKILFCARAKKDKAFISDAYLLESNIERINKAFSRYRNLMLKVNDKIYEYYKTNDINKKKDEDLDLEKIAGSKLIYDINKIKDKIKNQMPQLSVNMIDIKKRHRKLMEELYPKTELKDYDFHVAAVPTQENDFNN